MNSTTTVSSQYEYAERWQRWERGSVKSARRGSIQARITFAIGVTAALVWLGLRALPWAL